MEPPEHSLFKRFNLCCFFIDFSKLRVELTVKIRCGIYCGWLDYYLKPPLSLGSSSFLASAGISEEVLADEVDADGEGIFLGKASDSC